MIESANQTISVNCPICSKGDTWHLDNHFKPFCSERCKLIDLGEWASETRKIMSNEPIGLSGEGEL